jgi:hypothetical protein
MAFYLHNWLSVKLFADCGETDTTIRAPAAAADFLICPRSFLSVRSRFIFNDLLLIYQLILSKSSCLVTKVSMNLRIELGS